MPSATAMYGGGGRYLKAVELQPLNQRKNVVIRACEARVVRDQKTGNDKEMLALVMTTPQGKALEKELLLNQTNIQVLVGAFGDDYLYWGGKPIQIWSQIVNTPNGNQPGIRLAASGVALSATVTNPLPPTTMPPATAEAEAMADIGGGSIDDEIPFGPSWQ